MTGSAAYIDDPRSLERACERWRRADALGIDTEFVRERTFFPGLGLIQIAHGEESTLIDPIALEDLTPFRDVLTDRRITKVLHSCGEDLEVFFHRFGELPRPIFDTQIAAALAGFGYSLGYSGLVDALFGADVPKQHTRTNWLRRPLSSAQLKYAALDVAYLLPSYKRLRDALRQTGRGDWAREEMEQLQETDRFLPDPESIYLKIRRTKGLSRRQLGALRALAAWREREARRRDLPRSFVLREAALPLLARHQPRTFRELSELAVLERDELRRHGRTLIGLIARVAALADDELPAPPERPVNLSRYRRRIDEMRRTVAEVASRLGLPAELLATRRTVERLARRVVAGKEPPLPSELRGWRRQVVGEGLLEIFSQKNFS